MKTIVIALISFLFSYLTLSAQNSTDFVLQEVVKNNTGLIALKKQAEAEKIGNYTGIYLRNPEVEFGYLWGNPSSMGNRIDFSVMQSFDFPSAYSYKNKMAGLQNQQAELEYQKQLRALQLQARLLCVDLVFANANRNEYNKRIINAQTIANSYKSRFEKGEVSILDYNKAQLNLLNLKKEAETKEIQRQSYLAELKAINGGVTISFNDSIYTANAIPVDFEQWYLQAEKSSPMLAWLINEIEISRSEAKLNLAEGLPKFLAGYKSESVAGQSFQGINVGISIPLWENKNAVKYAKARTVALQSLEIDNKLQFYNQLKMQHAKAIALQASVEEYKTLLKSFDNTALLEKALNVGEMSILDYLFEISFYYESKNKLLEAEYEMNIAISSLSQYSE